MQDNEKSPKETEEAVETLEYGRFKEAIDKFDKLVEIYDQNESAEGLENLKRAYDDVVKRRLDYQASLHPLNTFYRARKPEWELFQDAINDFDNALEAYKPDQLGSEATLETLREAYFNLLKRGVDYKATIEEGHEFVDAITSKATRCYDKVLGNPPEKKIITIYDVTKAFRDFSVDAQKASEKFSDPNKMKAQESYNDLEYFAEKCLKNNNLTEEARSHIKELMSLASLLLSSAYQTAFSKVKADDDLIILEEEEANILRMDLVTWKDEDYKDDEIREQNSLWTNMMVKLFGENSEMTFSEYKNRLWDLENSLSKKYQRPLPELVNVDTLKLLRVNANLYCKAVLSENKNDAERFKARLFHNAIVYIQGSDDIPKHFGIASREIQAIFELNEIFDFELIAGISEYFGIKQLKFEDVYHRNIELNELLDRYIANKSTELKLLLVEKHQELHQISKILLDKDSPDRHKVSAILKTADYNVQKAMELSSTKISPELSFFGTKNDPTNRIKSLTNSYCTHSFTRKISENLLISKVSKYIKMSSNPNQAFEHFRRIIDEVVNTYNQDKAEEKKIDPSAIYRRINEATQKVDLKSNKK